MPHRVAPAGPSTMSHHPVIGRPADGSSGRLPAFPHLILPAGVARPTRPVFLRLADPVAWGAGAPAVFRRLPGGKGKALD